MRYQQSDRGDSRRDNLGRVKHSSSTPRLVAESVTCSYSDTTMDSPAQAATNQ